MILIVLLTAIITLTSQAPDKHKMDKIPVHSSRNRDILTPITLPYTPDTSILKQQNEERIMSS
jgi:hypothetical protein